MNEVLDLMQDQKSGFISVIVKDSLVAQMTFVFMGDMKIIIDHTQVDKNYNGRGYGKMMLAKAVEFARENQIKIIPLCPFAKSVFDKTPDYSDVL